ncbi:MAG: DUF4301 family protein [Prolixibacteraceae bacterium]|nr:DUF4301 family protein [Prolixibacteraceae bacterium]
MFTNRNLEQIQDQGLTIEKVEQQLNHFIEGFPQIHLVAPATPQKGIIIISEEDESRYISVFENALSSGLKSMKFVPASGAASRMFKNLYEYLEQDDESPDAFMQYFFNNLSKFAFYDQLQKVAPNAKGKELVKHLLSPDGLGYGSKPKGLLLFHKYKDTARTPFEEHLVEAASYCTASNGIAHIHYTVSPEHLAGFEDLLKKVKTEFQKRFGIQIDVTFSFQHKSTDTIAVDRNNQAYKDENGDLLFRPGGHGALIENLNELDADIIFIKNIDNVVPDRLKHETKRYKKALAGLLVTLRNKVFNFLERLDQPSAVNDQELLTKVEVFIRKELLIDFNQQFENNGAKLHFFITKLNRPIRICGMVKNEGEPGGGPFWAKNPDGTVSLQIIEKAQINLNDPDQAELLNSSTHFNPVDLICSTKNYKGEKFDLQAYVDPATGFISSKSKDGIELKALELPGLWNGAMSNWNTIFVEVPNATFNPVKTVNDLLRPEHQ